MKKFETNDVVTIKLISGEEIIAKFHTETDATICVSKPYLLAGMAQGLGLVPYVLTAQETSEICIAKHAIVCACNSDSDMYSQYIQTTSNIKIVSP